MTTTRQEIAARRSPPQGVAALKVDNRRALLIDIARQHLGITGIVPLSGGQMAGPVLTALEAAFEAGRRYPARGAKGRAR